MQIITVTVASSKLSVSANTLLVHYHTAVVIAISIAVAIASYSRTSCLTAVCIFIMADFIEAFERVLTNKRFQLSSSQATKAYTPRGEGRLPLECLLLLLLVPFAFILTGDIFQMPFIFMPVTKPTVPNTLSPC